MKAPSNITTVSKGHLCKIQMPAKYTVASNSLVLTSGILQEMEFQPPPPHLQGKATTPIPD